MRLAIGCVVFIAAVVALAGCSSRDPVGKYEKKWRHGKEVLTINQDGTYSHQYIPRIGEAVGHTATWAARSYGVELMGYVEYVDYEEARVTNPEAFNTVVGVRQGFRAKKIIRNPDSSIHYVKVMNEPPTPPEQ